MTDETIKLNEKEANFLYLLIDGLMLTDELADENLVKPYGLNYVEALDLRGKVAKFL